MIELLEFFGLSFWASPIPEQKIVLKFAENGPDESLNKGMQRGTVRRLLIALTSRMCRLAFDPWSPEQKIMVRVQVSW